MWAHSNHILAHAFLVSILNYRPCHIYHSNVGVQLRRDDHIMPTHLNWVPIDCAMQLLISSHLLCVCGPDWRDEENEGNMWGVAGAPQQRGGCEIYVGAIIRGGVGSRQVDFHLDRCLYLHSYSAEPPSSYTYGSCCKFSLDSCPISCASLYFASRLLSFHGPWLKQIKDKFTIVKSFCCVESIILILFYFKL